MNYEIPEKRTYKCIQKDKSVSLTDLTPQNLSDVNYWEEMFYAVGYTVYIRKKHLASIPDKSVTEGTYSCIETDYDIDTIMAANTNDILPSTFTRAVEVTLSDNITKYTIYPWSQKWERIGDLPPYVED